MKTSIVKVKAAKGVYILMLSVILVSALPACQVAPTASPIAKAENVEHITSPNVPADDLEAVVAGNNAFALDLYKAISDGNENLIFSPYSLALALAMTYAGARGETAQQIADTLHFTLPQERLHPALNSLTLKLARTNTENHFQLNIANAMWGQKGMSYQPEYLRVLAQNYGEGIRLVDFRGNPTRAINTVNEWANEKTGGRIPKIVNDLDLHTVLLIANAIYFNAVWDSPFNPSKTQDAPFYLLNGQEQLSPTMYQTNDLRYTKGNGYQAVELPYLGNSAAMIILLPEEGTFRAIESQLTDKWIQSIVSDLKTFEVTLSMPKFRFETFELDLKGTLSDMGMPDAFSDQKADFSGVTDSTRVNPIFIDKILHKTFINVTELRTEATAATIVRERLVEKRMPSPPIEMTIDRPFIFFIHDIKTGAILFAGRVLNPVNE